MTIQHSIDYDKVQQIGAALLAALGLDLDDENLKDTPRRYADWWREFLEYDPGTTGTSFESFQTDQMVVVSNMRVYSVCAHHLLPFWCDVSIGYITAGRVLGLSKFGRVAHKHAHRLQTQEQLTKQIADEIVGLTGTENVAVLASGGEHLCMISRGIRTPACMVVSEMRGVFRENHAARSEFFSLCGVNR